jgi:hypothetical protein
MIASEKPQRTYRYRVVDVFTQHPLEGSPLAVFPDATGLDDLTMQRIAKELNLSETTFVIPSTRVNCAIGVRIFTSALSCWKKGTYRSRAPLLLWMKKLALYPSA